MGFVNIDDLGTDKANTDISNSVPPVNTSSSQTVLKDNSDSNTNNASNTIDIGSGFWKGAEASWHNFQNLPVFAEVGKMSEMPTTNPALAIDHSKDEAPTYYAAHGFAAEVGKTLADPVQLAINAATLIAPEVRLGAAVTDFVLKNFSIGAVAGLGSTLETHYELQGSGIDDHITAGDVATNVAEGGVGALAIGGLFHAGNYGLSKIFANYGKDIRQGTAFLANDYEYNPANPDVPHEMKQVNTDVPQLTPQEISHQEALKKLTLTPQSETYLNDKVNFDRAIDLHQQGVTADKLHQMVINKENEIIADHSQMLHVNKDVATHLFDDSNNVAIRKAIRGETDGVSERDIVAAKLYNDTDDGLIKQAQGLGVDIGQVDSYVKQIHDVDRMRAAGVDKWIDTIQPRLANDLTHEDLHNMFGKIVNQDLTKPTSSDATNSFKERKLHFKTAQDAWEYEQAFGYNQTIGNHYVNNIQTLAPVIARKAVAGAEADPDRVMQILADLNGKSSSEVKRLLSDFTPPSKSPKLPDVVGDTTSTLLNITRAANAIVKPGYVLLHSLGDLHTLFHQTWLRSGFTKAFVASMKGLTGSKVSDDLMYLANLPFEQKENWKNIFNEWQQGGKIDTLNFFGIKYSAAKARFMQRATLKLNGAHMLDGFVRKQALRAGAYIAREEFNAGSLLPNLNQDILKQSINDDGFLSPQKLLNVADSYNDDIDHYTDNVRQSKAKIYELRSIRDTQIKLAQENHTAFKGEIKANIDKLKDDYSSGNSLIKKAKNKPALVKALDKSREPVVNDDFPDGSIPDVVEDDNSRALAYHNKEIALHSKSLLENGKQINQVRNEINTLQKKVLSVKSIDKKNLLRDKIDYNRSQIKYLYNESKSLKELINTNLTSIKDMQDTLLGDIQLQKQNITDSVAAKRVMVGEARGEYSAQLEQAQNELIQHQANLDNLKAEKQKHVDVANQLQNFYSSIINDVNPIYSSRMSAINKLDKSVAAGARSMAWQLRMYAATYGEMVKQVAFGPNKVRALSSLVSYATTGAAVATGLTYMINWLEGKHEGRTYSPVAYGIDKIAKNVMPDELATTYANEFSNHVLAGASILNAPLWFGEAATVFKGLGDFVIGDNDAAIKQAKKAIPPVFAIVANLIGGH